jgi:hypothetical protein
MTRATGEKREIAKIRESCLIQGDCLELGDQFPDPGSCMHGHVGVIADLVNLGDRLGGAETDALCIIHEQLAGLIGHTPDIPRDGAVIHDVLQHLDTVLDGFFRTGHGIPLSLINTTMPPYIL